MNREQLKAWMALDAWFNKRNWNVELGFAEAYLIEVNAHTRELLELLASLRSEPLERGSAAILRAIPIF